MELSTRTPSNLQVRDAEPAELDAVATLLAEVYGVFQPHFPADAWLRYLGEIVDVRSRLGHSQIIVATQAARLAGTVGFLPDGARSRLERWPTGWASIRTLGVRHDARGHGVGTALARECVRRARHGSSRAIGLHTASFMTTATRLYERVGFRRAAEYDIEIGEMFGGRSLPPDATWQAQAFKLVLDKE